MTNRLNIMTDLSLLTLIKLTLIENMKVKANKLKIGFEYLHFNKKKDNEENTSKTRSRLLSFLTESSFYNARRILTRLPDDGKHH